MSLSRSPPGSSRSNVNALVMPRYASRTSMRRHHCASPTTGAGDGHDQTRTPQRALTCTDDFLGRYKVERYQQQRDEAVAWIRAELARVDGQRARDAHRPPGDKTRKKNEAAHLRAECALRDP